MKILEDYKKIARELLFEVDDEKIIKYKDEDGESKEMKAGSAKTMPDEHPAKQAYNKMKDDGGDDKEKPSGQKIGGSDFDRDGGDDEPKSDDKPKEGGAKSISDEEFEKLNTFGDYSYKTTDNYQTAEDDNMMGNVRSSIYKDIIKKTGVDEKDFIDIAAYYDEEDYDTLGDYYDDLMKQAKEDKAKETKGESIKVINGKKYRPIKESKEPTKPKVHPFKETYKKIGGK